MGAMRLRPLLPFLLALTACTGAPPGGSGGATPPPTPTSAPPGAGWTIRDQTPYARVGHTAVLDEDGDRMVVFGGGANDTWALPLSGPDAGVWAPILASGEYPPVHAYGGTLFADSAIYDPVGRRMIVLLNPTPATATANAEVDIWELSLSGPPVWKRLTTAGPSPGAEVQSGHLVLDRDGQRIFVAGGSLDQAAVWALSLGAIPTWTRFAAMPDEGGVDFYTDASLVLDTVREQLVLFGGHPRLGKLWGLSLATAEWTLLDPGNPASRGYGVTTVFDAAGDRLVLFGGDGNQGTSLFSLATQTWTQTPAGAATGNLGASGVLDPARGRVLYFSGQATPGIVNTTWALALDTLTLEELVPATHTANLQMGYYAAVWDPTRAAVVAFGSPTGPDTEIHGLAATDAWTSLAAGATPTVTGTQGIYDPKGQAILAFAGYGSTENDTVWRLASSPGATWEGLAVADGPIGREGYAAVHDEAASRMVIYGGFLNSSAAPNTLGDVWALSLDGTPSWAELSPAGAGPGKRHGQVAVYDPPGQRMLTYGGSDDGDTQWSDVFALSLQGAPAWTALSPSGEGPGPVSQPSAVYDSVGRRMIVVDLATTGARVFALDLGAVPAWHRFCWSGITPANSWDFPGSAPAAVILDDGLFVTVSGAAFRFDLTASYCD